MPYDITAVVTCAVIIVAVLWDGRVSKVETYFLIVGCFVLGATSWVTNILQATVFNHGINPYVVAVCLMALMLWKGVGGKAKGYILMVCALILGSTALVTSILPPLLNSAFDAVGVLFTQGF